MASRIQCPRCGGKKTWILKRGSHRCARCRFEWQPGRWPLRLTAAEWRRLLQWFVRGASSAAIAREARLGRKRVLRALAIVRDQIARTAPVPIRDVHDEDGGAGSQNERAGSARKHVVKRRTQRTSMLGIHAAHGLVWADVLRDADAEALRKQLLDAGAGGLVVWPDQDRYAAIAYRGRLHRLVHASGGRPTSAFGLVESFWAYAQRQLRARGGVRLARLDLYLAEYSWRYNHRRESPADQLRQLLAITHRAGRTKGTFPSHAEMYNGVKDPEETLRLAH